MAGGDDQPTTCHLAAQRIVPECCGQSPCVHAMPRETVHIGRERQRVMEDALLRSVRIIDGGANGQ
jgi:hypothetical protein